MTGSSSRASILKGRQRSRGGPAVTVRWRPDRDEMAALEERRQSATVTFDWDPGRERDPSGCVERECEARPGRGLTTYERRKLRHELEPQIRKARDRFTAAEWRTGTEADLEQHALWVDETPARPFNHLGMPR